MVKGLERAQALSRACLFATPCSSLHPAMLLFASLHAPRCSLPGSSGHYVFLQRIFPTQGSHPCLLCLLHWQLGSSLLNYLGSPKRTGGED